MLLSYNILILICLFIILVILILNFNKKHEDLYINPLDFTQEKNNVYTYLDHKVFIRNPDMLKFLDSTLYYIDISPPLYLQFIDELNRFYKNIWIINKLLVNDTVTTVNNHMTIILFEYKNLIEMFNSFQIAMLPDLMQYFYAQKIVFETIIKEQTETVCDKVNHFNFDHKCLTRYSTNHLDYNDVDQSKLQEGELMFI